MTGLFVLYEIDDDREVAGDISRQIHQIYQWIFLGMIL